MDRNFEDKPSWQLMAEVKLGCKIIKTDPDAPDFNIYWLINHIHMYIDQVTIKSTRNSLIDDISTELLEAAIEFIIKIQRSKNKAHKKDCSKCVTRV